MLPFIKNSINHSFNDQVVRGRPFSTIAISKFVQRTMINDVEMYFNKLWGEKWRTFFYLNLTEHSCDLLSRSLFSFSEQDGLYLQ